MLGRQIAQNAQVHLMPSSLAAPLNTQKTDRELILTLLFRSAFEHSTVKISLCSMRCERTRW